MPLRFPVQVDFAALPPSAALLAVTGGGQRYRLSGTAALSRAVDPAVAAVVPAVLGAPPAAPVGFEGKVSPTR